MELVDGTCVEWLKDRKIRTDNKSGCKGVYKRKSGKYSVTIHLEEKGRTGSRMGEGTSFPI